MTKPLSLAIATGIAASLAGAAWPAAAQDDPGAAIVAALTGPIMRLAAASGIPADQVFAKPPTATEGADGWQVELPSWRLRLAADGTPAITLGCAPERWTATIAADGTVSGESDSPMACEVRTLGEGGSLQRFLAPTRHATAVIGADGERWSFTGDALAYGSRGMPSTETATTGPFEITVETGPSATTGLEDATASASFDNVDWTESMFGLGFHADRISYAESVEGLDVAGALGLIQEAVALGAAMQSAGQTFDPDAPADSETMARVAALLPKLADVVGSIRETMSAQGFTISMFGTSLRLGTVDYAWALEDVRSDDSTGSLRMSLGDVSVEPAQPEVEPWLPRHMVVSARVEGLPLPSLIGVLADVVVDPSLADGSAAIADLSRAFERAGAKLVVDTFSWRSDAFAFDAEGEIAATAATAIGLTARAGLTVAGLDALIEMVQHLPEGDAVAAGLTALSLFGKPGRALDGKDSRTYEFSVSEDGRILLNGTDLSKLLQ